MSLKLDEIEWSRSGMSLVKKKVPREICRRGGMVPKYRRETETFMEAG